MIALLLRLFKLDLDTVSPFGVLLRFGFVVVLNDLDVAALDLVELVDLPKQCAINALVWKLAVEERASLL